MHPIEHVPAAAPESGLSPVKAENASAHGRYSVIEELASGGMGVVYRVFDRVTGQERALKRARSVAKDQRFIVEALQREYHVLATLDHPRIIHVFDYGIDDAGPYYTMELLAGSDMRQLAPLPYRTACLHVRDVATSLALLHARRLLHRDLSPGNVRTTDDGRCKLLDFGALAAFGHSEVLAGTPPVVPPEAFGHIPLDQRADLYSLGALAYWMLTGRHAFPARRLEDLPTHWQVNPPPPSSVVPGIPAALDTLVLSLLAADPLARPASAAEVIARLTSVGELPDESTTETKRLALSFLSNPRFIGRAAPLETARALARAAIEGHGGAVWIEAIAGMGRTRLLEEIGLRARLGACTVVCVDASMAPQSRGTVRALVLGVADVLPELARKHAGAFRRALGILGRDVRARLGIEASNSAPPETDVEETVHELEGWFVEISRERPLVVQVDNVERADDATLGLLAGLASVAHEYPLVVMVTACSRNDRMQPVGLTKLRTKSVQIELAGLGAGEMAELTRSLFGEAPGAERFAHWLSACTAGSPLHALELARQLLGRNAILYSAGVWTLPDRAPDAEAPVGLHDALLTRLSLVGESARELVECLSLQRHQPTLELCSLLCRGETSGAFPLLEELAAHDVLEADRDGYRFTSTALRDALLGAMDDARLERSHRRLGDAFAQLAADESPSLRIEAGWHLIQGGEDLRGADMIADVVDDPVVCRDLSANLHRIGAPLEAALKTYGKYRRSAYERMPLLSGLAQAGFYEDRTWGDRYGDEALYLLEEVSGLRTARNLRRFFGGWIALLLGILVALARYRTTPRAERPPSFGVLMVHLFGTVTALTGVAGASFDPDRADRIADVLQPFSVLPQRLTPVGIYQFCRATGDAVRENQAVAYETFEKLLARFKDRRYYPTLPAEARKFYIAGAHYIRGTFAIFRADGRGALESADALDRVGLKLYAMIASQLRRLYYTFRGEFATAAFHRERAELHGAHMGSLWQVEPWENATLLLVYPQIGDIVGTTRLAHRLDILGRTVPSLKRYANHAHQAIFVSRGETPKRPETARTIAEFEAHVPRSYIGWAAAMGYVARAYNLAGSPTQAKAVCERALTHVTDRDREYVLHFITLDLELAIADAALGQTDEALARIDALLARHEPTQHRLALGLLLEARARIAWGDGRLEEYERSLHEVERWFLPVREPALVAKCQRLRDLRAGDPSGKGRPSGPRTDDPSIRTTASLVQSAETVVLGKKRRDRDVT
jgi:tRNA A-37 threonylcarbamoyl transferase component Bud32